MMKLVGKRKKMLYPLKSSGVKMFIISVHL